MILSAGDESPSQLAATADSCLSSGLSIRIDAQLYIYSIAPQGSGRHHKAHGFDFASVHWSQNASAAAEQVRAVGDLNERLNPAGKWVAPSVLQGSFADVWTPVALQLARTAADTWGPEKTIATLAIDEIALDTWSMIDDWLDVATSLEVHGFYILIARSNASYPPVAWSSERLSNLLRLIYTLSELNGYDVSWGYSDAEGLLGIAAGATSIASGWSYSLRQFYPQKWQPSENGPRKPPTPRITVNRLWSSLRADTELSPLLNSHLRESILHEDQDILTSAQPIGLVARADAQAQFLESLATRAHRLNTYSLSDRLDRVSLSLENALELFDRIEASNIVLEARYKPRVRALLDSLVKFRESESL
ncbi:MAG: hypothetical protein ACOH14_02385 [Rhodoglobus sp.]